MKNPLNCKRCSRSQHRSSALLGFAAAVAMLGTSACTSRQTVGVASWQDHGVKVGYDLPVDYLSGKYRQLYRTHPHWFHNHDQPSQVQGQTYYGTSMSK